jgi:hypothetical protein
MKKIIISLFAFSVLFLSSSAFANVSFTPTSPQTAGTTGVVSCGVGNVYIQACSTSNSSVPCSAGDIIRSKVACNNNTYGFETNSLGTYTYVECNPITSSSSCSGYGVLSEALADNGFIAQANFTFTAPIIPPRNAGISILGGTAPSIGTPLNGSALTAGITGAVGNTMNGLGPIIALVVGIILAFIVAIYFMNTFRSTDKK